MIRNCLCGKRRAEAYGGWMRAGYLPDNFGHPLQMPQILQGFGIDSLMFMRGMPEVPGGHPDEFIYCGIDGSEVIVSHFRESCADAFDIFNLPPQINMGESVAAANAMRRGACGDAGAVHEDPSDRGGRDPRRDGTSRQKNHPLLAAGESRPSHLRPCGQLVHAAPRGLAAGGRDGRCHRGCRGQRTADAGAAPSRCGAISCACTRIRAGQSPRASRWAISPRRGSRT